eukprot:TRINITY_DN1_c0_g1_i6.p1 TRINITY_DN1_c0_g1~~TRINITY_DN1_c0_g1_i6.p1  ORF type:complete len:102 (-),score=14.51 TRINITY_DN1_c0_g1_i6:147-452(-)
MDRVLKIAPQENQLSNAGLGATDALLAGSSATREILKSCRLPDIADFQFMCVLGAVLCDLHYWVEKMAGELPIQKLETGWVRVNRKGSDNFLHRTSGGACK